MGDTRNRGKILWFLITARPDLLPIDLKRQGRAEEHIPLFYPETVGGVRRDLPGDAQEARARRPRSTSVSRGRRRRRCCWASPAPTSKRCWCAPTLEAEAAEATEVTAEHLKKAFADFIPPANTLEREMQILCAVLECTSRELLPEQYRDLDRGEVQARINEIKRDAAAGLRRGARP